MATMSPSDIRTYVYDHTDTEVEDIPTSVLDIFMEDGYNRLLGYFEDSPPWLQVEYSFTCEAGTSAYDLDTYTGLTTPTPLQHVMDVRGPRWTLRPTQHRQVRESWRQDSPPEGTPTEWSQWGRSIYLWPEPTAAEDYTIAGVRQPTDWLSTNSALDCPAEFHRVVADYTLGRAYAQQDDPEMATLYLDAFVPAIRQLAKRWSSGVRAQPVVVNGGRNAEPYRAQRVLGPLTYEWE